MAAIETDYLVVGAGASGMAFTDTLIEQSDEDVVILERRASPGGHWIDAYPFVQLHQPSAVYGVNSSRLGNNRIDEDGPNAGFYERATASEICDYYRRVLEEEFLCSGQVRFFGMVEYIGQSDGRHRFESLLTGETTEVEVTRRLVDASYVQSSIPSTHTPPFQVEPEARLVTPNELVRLSDPGEGFTVIGAGKTAMDTCGWLLEHGVPAEEIRWIRPRDPWTIPRRYMQTLEHVQSILKWASRLLEAAAEAEDAADLFRRLEASGVLVPLDPEIAPETFRGAILSRDELDALRQIQNVIRKGYVKRLEANRIVLDDGIVPTDQQEVHIDCTASAVDTPEARPVFEPERITVQYIIAPGVVPFSAAMTAYIEATRHTDAEKNRLCPPNPLVGDAEHFVRNLLINQRARARWNEEPDIQDWLQDCRLRFDQGVGEYLDDPELLDRIDNYRGPAIENLERIDESTTYSGE